MPVDFIATGTVTLSSTALNNAQVIIRNERTNKSGTVTTNSLGKFVYSCNNLEDGWTAGDIITAACIYQNYEVSSSYTILETDGGHDYTLALVTVAVGDLNYCAIQDVFDYLGFDTNTVEEHFTAEQIRKIGLRMEDAIERRCNSVFHDNDGSYTTVTNEYADVRNQHQRFFFVRKRPVVDMTTVEANIANETSTANWSEITSSVKTDLDTGRIDTIAVSTGYPSPGPRMIRFTYTYGHATTPEDIKQLTVLMICRELINSTVAKALLSGRDNFRATELDVLDNQIEEIFKRHTFDHMVNV